MLLTQLYCRESKILKLVTNRFGDRKNLSVVEWTLFGCHSHINLSQTVARVKPSNCVIDFVMVHRMVLQVTSDVVSFSLMGIEMSQQQVNDCATGLANIEFTNPVYKTHPWCAVGSWHDSIDWREWNQLFPFDPLKLGAFAFVHQHIELTFRSELRVLGNNANVVFLLADDTLLHVTRHWNGVDCGSANICFGIL